MMDSSSFSSTFTVMSFVSSFFQHMTLMFEVQDLAVASPATVSRCGMVYLEPSYIGLAPFVECWLRGIPENIWPYKDKLQELFDKFMEVSFFKVVELEIFIQMKIGQEILESPHHWCVGLSVSQNTSAIFVSPA